MQAWPAHLHGERDGARPRAVKKRRTAEQSEVVKGGSSSRRRARRRRRRRRLAGAVPGPSGIWDVGLVELQCQ